MALNNLADLSTTAGSNTDFRGQSTQGSALVSTIDSIFQNLGSMLARFYDDMGATGTVGGTADAITLTTTSGFQSLANGLITSFKAGAANTGAATINVDTLGAKAIRRQGDSALSANDIAENGVYLIRYDTAYNSAAGAWVLLNPTVSSSLSNASTTEQLTGTSSSKYATPDSVAALWEKGSDIASASTITIGEGGYFHVTGTTAITDIDWAMAKDGREVCLIFDAALTLTHNSTTLKLPGGANITTAAGDRAYFRQDSSDNVICTAYTKADGTALVTATSGGPTLGTEQATTSGTTKDFSIDAGAKRITVMLNGVTSSSNIGIQLGDSGGIEATGYTGTLYSDSALSNPTTNFEIITTDASGVAYGHIVLTRLNSTHTWIASAVVTRDGSGTDYFAVGAGAKTLSAELTTVRVMGGTLGAGSVNVLVDY